MKRFTLLLAVAGLTLAALAARGQEPTPEDLKRQRATADATYEAAAARCQKRFAVNACEERAREAHRAEAGRLRAIELARSDAKRQQRAQTHAARVEARQSPPTPSSDAASASSTTPDAMAQLADDLPLSAGTSTPTGTTVADRGPDRHSAKQAGPERVAVEKANRDKFEERQQHAAEHREQLERRNAEREGHKKAAPLPVPASAASDP